MLLSLAYRARLVAPLALFMGGVAIGSDVMGRAAGPALAAARRPAPPASFANQEALLHWIDSYRRTPEPRRLPEAVQAMVRFGITRDLDQAGVYVGFTAGVIGSNPEQAEDLIAAMFPLDPQDQVLLIRAIAYSGHPDWQGVMRAFVERMPARKVLIDKFLFGHKETLETLPFADNSAAIDLNWGYYFATGAEAPVRRIVSVLAWSRERDSVEKLTIGAMAKWTLAQNAARDVDLLELLKSVANEGPEAGVREPLAEVIDAAETLELAKLRRQAMASIEELRAKGPESARNFAWWGQAGQTVLALGCVAAGALGQVEVGLPCVVGGAVSSAALKYLAPTP